jgi:hypothetical protein
MPERSALTPERYRRSVSSEAGDHGLRPPEFAYGELVRIVEVTGEVHAFSDLPIDPGSLLGREVVVEGAAPTTDRDGWVIYVWIDGPDDVVEFPEHALKSTGRILLLNDDGTRTPHTIDPVADQGWRDDVEIDLTTSTTDREEAEAIAARATATLAKLETVDEVASRIDERSNRPIEITLWAWSKQDALQAFTSVLALTTAGWEDDPDDDVFITSHWTRTGNDEFLARGVEAASVVYRRWTSPKRRSRSEIVI